MSALFLELLNLSILAGWIVLAVIPVRLCLKKAPKYINCILWGLVGIRLIFPFSIESIFSLVPSKTVVAPRIVYDKAPAINSGIPIIDNVANTMMTESFTPNVAESVNPLQVVTYVASYIWLLGVIAMLIYCIVSYLLVKRKVFDAVKLQDNVYVSEKVATPFVLGIFKPRIYIPHHMDEESKKYVVIHEQSHIRRGDHITKLAGFLVLSVYWFNPLIWIAYIFLCKDIELACDEKVLKSIGVSEKKNYSKVLLEYSVSPKMITACPLAFGEVAVKQRIKSALNYKKPAFWLILLSVIVCMVVAVCFLTSPKEKVDKEIMAGENIVPDKEVVVNDTQVGQKKQDTDNHIANVSKNENHQFYVMVDDALYYCSWISVDENIKCGVPDGEIETSVEKDEMPKQNNQSNFGSGYGWQRRRYNEIVVYMPYQGKKQWMRFVKEGTVLGETEFDENTVLESVDNIFSITMVEGNSGKEIKTSRLMSDNTMHELIETYKALEFEPLEPEQEARDVSVGWQYSMKLYDVDGNMLQKITPYNNTIKIDGITYDSSMNYSSSSLLQYMNLQFHPVEAISGLYTTLDEVTPAGATFSFRNTSYKEVKYSAWFTMWSEKDGVWTEIAPKENESGFSEAGHFISPYASAGWNVTWEDMYGTLEEEKKYKIELEFFTQDENGAQIETVYAYEFIL